MYHVSTVLLALSSTDCTNLGGTVNHTCAGGYSLACDYYCSIPATKVPKQSYTSGSISSGPLSARTTFALHCTNASGGVGDDSATVEISGNSLKIATTTDGKIDWQIDPPPSTCSLTDNGLPVSLSSETSGEITPTDAEIVSGATYILTCTNGETVTDTLIIPPALKATCVSSQNYVNRKAAWTLEVNGANATGVTWNFAGAADSGNPAYKIFTTIGPKTITGTGMLNGKPVTCSTTTTVKLAPATSQEI
jgi:hypothetical protein